MLRAAGYRGVAAVVASAVALSLGTAAGQTAPPPELLNVTKTTTIIEAFRPVPEFDRHDPSNVIRHGDRYWVYYTRNVGDHEDVSVHAASSADGIAWEDAGLAIGAGPAGAWDESGAIAPYVVPFEDRFYLFYTGFREKNLATRDLGIAVADSPEGPWERWESNPVLRRHQRPDGWDSGMLGDANVIYRERRWWLYYKGRRADEANVDTRIGVAFATKVTGPFNKYPNNPLFRGHAYSAWVHRDGVAAVCGAVSPRVKWSANGLIFVDLGNMANTSTGFFSPIGYPDGLNTQGVSWGIEQYRLAGKRGLRRFDCSLSVPGAPAPKE